MNKASIKEIKEFKKEYSFLSNFYKARVEFEGLIYPTVEHAFQAAKTLDLNERELFLNLEYSSPAIAKKLGRLLTLRQEWDTLRLGIMEILVHDKFAFNEDLKERLLKTGNAHLMEGNYWGDKFWGVDLKTGIGENNLGKILMRVRDQLRWPSSDR